MRVIAGSSRGRRLVEFKGRNVRPTPDRVREALFSILQSKLGSFVGIRVLDLFAGSGALAIEALSRGAAAACLIDSDKASAKIIFENLERCQFINQATLITRDAFLALRDLPENSFDLIFLDPPYNKDLAAEAVNRIGQSNILCLNGLVCAETGANESMPKICGRLVQIDQRRYGSVMIHFYTISDEGP